MLHKIKRVWSRLTLLILLSIVLIVFVPTCNWYYQLSNKPKSTIKAEIIDEKYYLPNNPVSHSFYYNYFFVINGEAFKGSSQSHDYRPGDSIMVEYVIQHPQYNKPTEGNK